MTRFPRHSQILALALAVAAPALGQEDGQEIRELNEVTADGLIDVLQPKDEPLTRGLSVLPSPNPPDCAAFRSAQEEGRESPAVSDIAAVTVRFALNSDRVTSEAAEVLAALGEALTSDRLSGYCFRLEGHTDSSGAADYNLDLATRRARSVARHLVDELGVDEGQLVVAGYGESRPLADNATEAGRERNRRVQVMNLGTAPAGG